MIADHFYSAALLLSLVAGGASLTLALAGALGRLRRPRRPALIAAVTAWIALALSLVIHLGWGHTPGTPSALALVPFLEEHRSFVMALILPGVALVFERLTRARGDDVVTAEELDS